MRLISTAIDETGATKHVAFADRGDYRPVHVEVSAAATVSIQGRAAQDLDWFELWNVTATGIENVLVMYEMQVVVTGNTGNVEVELDARAA